MKKPQSLGTALLALALAGGVCISLAGVRADHKATVATNRSNAPIPSLDSPEVKAALAQTQSVLDVSLAAGWRYGRPPVPSKDLKLPGQINAEDPHDRGKSVISYRIAFSEDAADPEMAFFSETYVRRNVRHLKGEHSAATPEGFYIVAYRDGRVVTVPADRARTLPMLPDPNHPTWERRRMVFPGMKGYDDPKAEPAIPVDS